MTLVDQWGATSTTTATVRTFAVPRAIDTDKTLVMSITLGSNSASINITDARGNSYDESLHIVHSGATFNNTLVICQPTTAIQAGDLLTITSSASTNRCAVAAGVFDDVLTPMTPVELSSSSSSQNISTGPTAALVTDKSLVLYGVGGAGSIMPVSAGAGMTLVQNQSTAAGSAERSASLLYKYETTTTHSASAVLNAAVISTSLLMALASEPDVTPPDGPDFHATWFNGSVERNVSSMAWYDGSTLTPVPSLDFT